MTIKIGISHFNARCVQAGDSIHRLLNNKDSIKLYGVPRGGITVAYGIAANCKTIGFNVVDKPEDSDIIVDDLMDSGNTQKRYQERFPNIPFYAIYGSPKDWLVFPWENTILDSADDIPVRLLQFIKEKPERGGLKETPKRFLKAWKHFTSGYDKKPEDVMKVFEDGAETYNQMVLVKNIPVYSQCEHHLVPFFGVAHIGYIPDGKIVGLSKLSRVVDIFARRLQVQERLTDQIAQALEDNLLPKGVAVVIECRHLCMEARGICQQGHTTITSAMRGAFLIENTTRAEFMGLIKNV